MYRGNRPAQAVQRQVWLRRFEAALVALKPTLSGRIDWDTAIYLCDQGYQPEDAAERVASQ